MFICSKACRNGIDKQNRKYNKENYKVERKIIK